MYLAINYPVVSVRQRPMYETEIVGAEWTIDENGEEDDFVGFEEITRATGEYETVAFTAFGVGILGYPGLGGEAVFEATIRRRRTYNGIEMFSAFQGFGEAIEKHTENSKQVPWNPLTSLGAIWFSKTFDLGENQRRGHIAIGLKTKAGEDLVLTNVKTPLEDISTEQLHYYVSTPRGRFCDARSGEDAILDAATACYRQNTSSLWRLRAALFR